MEVTVGFTTQLKAALGMSQQTVSLRDGGSVQDAIHALAEIHPHEFARLVLTDGQLMPSILLSVNDQQVDADAKLCDGDMLMLLSAISGG
jgi:molybdopterin converting factor small subunit